MKVEHLREESSESPEKIDALDNDDDDEEETQIFSFNLSFSPVEMR